MRPMYETDADLKREGGIVVLVEQAWKCKAVKLPIKYHLDYALTRDEKVVSFCEMKTRNYTMEVCDKYGGYSIGLGKWITAKTTSETSALPFVLVVKLNDGLYYSTFGDGHNSFKPDDMIVAGRTDRGDAQDIEPMVIIRAERFKKLKD